jgi:ADP-ribose pyrophosphatase
MIAVIEEAIIMVRQFRHTCGKTPLKISAGTLNLEEIPDDAARRELVEEIGYVPGKTKRLLHFYVSPGSSSEQVYFYLATDLSHTVQDLEADKAIRVVKINLATFLHTIERSEIEDVKSIAGILYFSKYLQDS